MSANTLTLKVVSPQGVLLETEAVSVQFPGEDGSFGILPRHAAMTSLTESGLLRARTAQGEQIEYVIHDGFAQVRNNVVTVLTRSAACSSKVLSNWVIAWLTTFLPASKVMADSSQLLKGLWIPLHWSVLSILRGRKAWASCALADTRPC